MRFSGKGNVKHEAKESMTHVMNLWMMTILKTTIKTTLKRTLKTLVSTKEIMIQIGKYRLTINLYLHSAVKLTPQPMKLMMLMNTKLTSEIITIPIRTFESRAQTFRTIGYPQLRLISGEN